MVAARLAEGRMLCREGEVLLLAAPRGSNWDICSPRGSPRH